MVLYEGLLDLPVAVSRFGSLPLVLAPSGLLKTVSEDHCRSITVLPEEEVEVRGSIFLNSREKLFFFGSTRLPFPGLKY